MAFLAFLPVVFLTRVGNFAIVLFSALIPLGRIIVMCLPNFGLVFGSTCPFLSILARCIFLFDLGAALRPTPAKL